MYVFGYVSPIDGVSLIPLYQATRNKYIISNLPKPAAGTSLTCYAQVISPNGATKTYYTQVTVNAATMTSSDFTNLASTTVMDDLIESIQMRDKLNALSAAISNNDKA